MKTHIPVMLAETLERLDIKPGQTVLDATLGLGGHSAAILERLGNTGRLIGLDQNAGSLSEAKTRLAKYAGQTELIQANFREIGLIIDEQFGGEVDRVLFDLGVASWQLDEPGMGLSFQVDEPLDMRLDHGLPETAADLIGRVSTRELATILRVFGDEPKAHKMAEAIKKELPTTTRQLADLAMRVKGRSTRRIHPATLVFQALRIAVNDELGALEAALKALPDRMRPGGKVVVMSYHSGEDRLVKQTFREWAADCHCPPGRPVCDCDGPTYKLLTKHAVKPSEAEVLANPRARSARLRAVEKI